MFDGVVTLLPRAADVAPLAADMVASAARSAVSQRARFNLVLAGGSTPKQLYQLLASEYAAKLPWAQTHFYFGDERCVPYSHESSNARTAQECLFGPLGIPEAQIHRMPTDVPPEQGAAEYEALLRSDFPAASSTADLVLLGMGADGHTLSLFPGDAAAVGESQRWCIHTKAPAPFAIADRITLTLPFVNAARARLFMVTGADKEPVFAAMRSNAQTPPAALVKKAHWLRAG
jgi:6-phosphogluconolactonase